MWTKTLLHLFACWFVSGVMSEDDSSKSLLSFYHVGSGDHTQIIRLKHLTSYLGKIMAKCFPCWMKNMNLQIHEVQWILSSINLKKSRPTYIISNLVKDTENAKNRKKDMVMMVYLSTWHNLELPEREPQGGIIYTRMVCDMPMKCTLLFSLCSWLWI